MRYQVRTFESDPSTSVLGAMLAQPSLFELSRANRSGLKHPSILFCRFWRRKTLNRTGNWAPL